MAYTRFPFAKIYKKKWKKSILLNIKYILIFNKIMFDSSYFDNPEVIIVDR